MNPFLNLEAKEVINKYMEEEGVDVGIMSNRFHITTASFRNRMRLGFPYSSLHTFYFLPLDYREELAEVASRQIALTLKLTEMPERSQVESLETVFHAWCEEQSVSSIAKLLGCSIPAASTYKQSLSMKVLYRFSSAPLAIRRRFANTARAMFEEKLGVSRDENGRALYRHSPCDHPGCQVSTYSSPSNRCSRCGEYFCHHHLTEGVCYSCSGSFAREVIARALNVYPDADKMKTILQEFSE